MTLSGTGLIRMVLDSMDSTIAKPTAAHKRRTTPSHDIIALHHALSRRGISAVLQAAGNGGVPHLSFILTAKHRDADIDNAVDALADAAPHFQQLGQHSFRETNHAASIHF